jgi:hypothetical protein
MYRWEDDIKLIADKSRRIHGTVEGKGCWHHRWNNEIYGLNKNQSIVDDIKIRTLGWADITANERRKYPKKFSLWEISTTQNQYEKKNMGGHS